LPLNGLPPFFKEMQLHIITLAASLVIIAQASGSSEDVELQQLEAAMQEGESVLDAPLAVIDLRGHSNQVSAEDAKSAHLHKLLALSKKNSKMLQSKVASLETNLAKVANAKKRLSKAAGAQVVQEEAKVKHEIQRANAAEAQLKSATRKAEVEGRAMKIIGLHLKKAEDEKKTVAQDGTQQLADAKEKLQKQEAINLALHKKVTIMSKEKHFLAHRAVSSAKSSLLLLKGNSLLKHQVASEVEREENIRQMYSNHKSSSAETGELAKAHREFRFLRGRVQILGQQAQRNDQFRYAAEGAANRAQAALQHALAENRQLKHMVMEARELIPVLQNEARAAARQRDGASMRLRPAQRQYPAAASLVARPNWFPSVALGPLSGRTELPRFPMKIPEWQEAEYAD